VRFEVTALKGVWIVHPVRHTDERGFFARTWCAQEFRQHGLKDSLSQCNLSFNKFRGTVRGMHFQAEPHGEAKLVRCTTGAVVDVIVDLRKGSESFLDHVSITLDSVAQTAVYIPEGLAHGFQTLEDSTEVFYQMSVPFCAESACGVRWNDPLLNIKWPLPVSMISEKDLSFPDFSPRSEPG
jgi:dTDP-4-dehydrorhamnose 3,5-epimerase